MLSSLSDTIVKVNLEKVLEYARYNGINVQSIEDFRMDALHYDHIERLMNDYRSSFARTSMLTGLTTGFGGITTSITFACIDTSILALKLYRLAQRFAILNGFDGSDPLHKDKMMTIYFESLSLNAVTQAALKHQFIKASELAGTDKASQSSVLSLIMKIGKISGSRISSKKASRWAPVLGGAIGAAANYSFARKTSKSMKKAFKNTYFDTWQ